ncbi:DNA polymerase I [Alicyclobacillus fastidiosus]|uniref:DNA polymerase I n=1 Tax=Alicyclobacillus fastidiosus TaxID=392011 RepID=A0ABV5AD69_9BACL|nr:DNA polymerase I [Alicyclobacillus fastidiosus]WEH10444.1 DNA polymerase I [Alicyclobacillus fastidiosus]
MSTQSAKLLLIDGNSILYRAFFALPPLSNRSGQQTNAVYGFTLMLLKLLQEEKPTHLAVAFDKSKKTFRHELYAEYKGTRQKTPSELVEQFPLVRAVLTAFSIPVIEIEGYEADDIIGTLSLQADEGGIDTRIVSGDKDLLQLVSERVHAILTRRGITDVDRYDIQAIAERYGLKPDQIVDLKGFMGDSSDNIPGVPGVGEKTAIKLLSAHPTVEEVLENLDDVNGAKLKQKLEEHRESALLSKRLATIDRHVPIDVTPSDLGYQGYDASAVVEVFRDLEFQSLIDKISEEMSGSTGDDSATVEDWTRTEFKRITSEAQLARVWAELGGVAGCMFDLSSNDYHSADVNGVALASRDAAFYISFTGELELSHIKTWLKSDHDKVVFDIKSLAFVLDAHGINIHSSGGWNDVKLEAYLLNPTDGEVELEDILSRELHIQVPPIAKVKDDREALLCRIAQSLPDLHYQFQTALTAQALDDLYRKIEMPLSFVLAKMEITGFHVNADKLRAFGADLSGRITVLTSEIYELAGLEFNLNSPKQLGEVLFEKLGLPAVKKTKTGYSTSADVLEKLAPYHDVVQRILDYRQLAKLQSTYVDGLLKVIRKETDRIHTRFHQALTATGRLSSSEPNLQNIPIRLEEGRKLRQVFDATYDDWVIVSADYSQVELRILAHLSGDEALIDAFRNDMDVHTRTASDVFEVPMEEVTSLMRRQAKAVNFGIVYGISDFGLANNLNIPQKEAKAFIANYFEKFPGVQGYMEDIVEQAKKQGYVSTLMNRRRYLPDIRARNFHLRSFAERTAMNTPIQGTAADIIKLAMVRIDEALSESGLDARMLLQVHDELIFECPKDELEELTQLVREKMENAITLNVPLKVDIAYGQTWYEAK